MLKPRRLNEAYNLARDGGPKRTTIPAPAHGAKRQTTGELAAYHHGIALGDEPNTVKSFENGTAPVHPGMVSTSKSNDGDALRGKHDPALGTKVLTEARDLGRKPAPKGEKA